MNFNVIEPQIYNLHIENIRVFHTGLLFCDEYNKHDLHEQLKGARLKDIVKLFDIPASIVSAISTASPGRLFERLGDYILEKRWGFFLVAYTEKPSNIVFNSIGQAVWKDYSPCGSITIRAFDPSFEFALEKLISAAEALQTSFEDELRAHRNLRIQHEKEAI